MLSLIIEDAAQRYEYSMMPFAIAFGFLLFGDVPSWFTLGDAVVVAASEERSSSHRQ
jgi:drug/metabolite transporter (DMT)-like permease